jgi:hypothetical protein
MTALALGATPEPYAARLAIDYPEKLDRFTTFFRLIMGNPHRPSAWSDHGERKPDNRDRGR